MYASLRTNLPRDLMAFLDFPFAACGGDDRRFPGHAEVLAYLERFAQAFELRPAIRWGHSVRCVVRRAGGGWTITVAHAGGSEDLEFDAVAVCNGHYAQPRIPELPGLETFGGRVTHSAAYRVPAPFAGRSVALLGAKSSGQDLARELAGVASRVVVCARSHQGAAMAGPNAEIELRPAIAHLSPNGSIGLTDGTSLDGIDDLLVCTGYHEHFEFLDMRALEPLWLDLLPVADPTIAFVGLPFMVVPFPLCQRQARLFARFLAGKAAIPEASERRQAVEARAAAQAKSGVEPRHARRYGEAQFTMHATLAELAGDQPPTPHTEALNHAVQQHRRRFPDAYRDRPLPAPFSEPVD